MKSRERASEIEYLRWFRSWADFGPGTGDVLDHLAEDFISSTGKDLPEGWNFYSDGETLTDTFDPDHEAHEIAKGE